MKNLLLFVLAAMLFAACQPCDDNPTPETDCDKVVVIDDDLYNSDEEMLFTIENIAIDGDCLEVTYSASGCDGSSWVMSLYGSETITTPQLFERYLRFDLDNQEECLAIFVKEESFDISDMQIEGESSISLDIQGYDQTVIYNY